MKSLRNTIVTALLGVVFLAGCADGPLAPIADVQLTHAEAKGGNTGGDGETSTEGNDQRLELLLWRTPLAQDITVSQLCMPKEDCEVRIDEVDVTLIVGKKALSAPLLIKMTAVAGDEVNLRFGPHGTQFDADVKVKVGQSETNGIGTTFTVYYYVNGLEDVQDAFPAEVKDGRIEFWTDHFSGYALGM